MSSNLVKTTRQRSRIIVRYVWRRFEGQNSFGARRYIRHDIHGERWLTSSAAASAVWQVSDFLNILLSCEHLPPETLRMAILFLPDITGFLKTVRSINQRKLCETDAIVNDQQSSLMDPIEIEDSRSSREMWLDRNIWIRIFLVSIKHLNNTDRRRRLWPLPWAC